MDIYVLPLGVGRSDQNRKQDIFPHDKSCDFAENYTLLLLLLDFFFMLI